MSRTSLPRCLEPARGRRPIVVMALLAGLAMADLPARAGAETLTFDTLPAGTLLTEQGGVSFGNGGLIVEAHAQARSSPNVAIPPLDGEFRRKKVFLVFDEAQTFVSIAVQATPAEYGRAYAVTLRADDGTTLHTIDTVTITFVADSNWRVLTVRNVAGTYSLRRAVLSGGQTDVEEPTNFFVIDDLEYSTAPPPPPPDTMPPQLWILRPSAGQAFDGSVIPVTVFARDDRRLRSVRGSITHLDTGHVAGRMDFCGSAASGACPATAPVDETASVSLDPAADGDYEAAVTACDTSSHCVVESVRFSVTLPPPPPEVSVERAEVNQGTQSRLFSIGRPGTDLVGVSPVRMVAGRDTAVRFYPLADGDYRRGYSARMTARITYRDGTTLERSTMPNAGVASIDVAPDQVIPEARENVYVLMRADRTRTLDYVVPGSLLRDARSLEVRLEDPAPMTGWLRVGFNPEVRLVVKHLRLSGPGIGGTDYPAESLWRNTLRYVEEALPVSEMVAIRTPSARVADDTFCEIFAQDFECAVWQLSQYEPPGDVPPSTAPTHSVTLGQLPFDAFPGLNGVATGHTAMSKAYGDTCAHELGHTAGRPHAGGYHSEAGGEEWSFGHGQVDGPDFGVVTQRLTPPGPFDLGQWELTVVDPCPRGTVSARLPVCALPDGVATHDLMSYGYGAAEMGELSASALRNRWPSSYTWNRLYDAIRASAPTSATATAADADGTAASADALLIDGFVDETGAVHPLPILRVRATAAQVQDPPPGPYRLELYGHGNQLLLSRRFDATEMHDLASGRGFLLRQLVPYRPDLQRVVVTRDGTRVLERSASRHAPTVRLMYPGGGEVLGAGTHTIAWIVGDADGDRVSSRVEYSGDGGRTWATLGLLSGGEATALEVDVTDLPASANARFRVSASDGFRTAVDASDCPVAVGTAAPVDCGTPARVVGLDVKPGSSDNCVNPASQGTLPAAILGAADLSVASIDARRLVLAGLKVRLRRDGSAQCAVADVGSPSPGSSDGFPDLVCHFEMDVRAWQADDGRAVLAGTLKDGTPIAGYDTVCIVP